MTTYESPKKMCEEHVDWFLNIIKQPLIEHMLHGYKHGFEDGSKMQVIRRDNNEL
jgi:hypothetical protein